MTVAGLFVYPVKAVRAVALREAAVEQRGLHGDRRWLFVDADGAFLTQRDHPILATVDAELTRSGLRLSAGGPGSIDLATPEDGAPLRRVVVWKDEVVARDAGTDAADWISELMGFKASLVWMGPEGVRGVNQEFGLPDDRVSFADGFPLLATNAGSLLDLNSKMPEPLPMNRFRPNIVVEGFEPWVEDRWRKLRVGEVEFRSVKLCGRCLVTTTDQRTGERKGEEPLRTLGTFRNIGGKVMFGVNWIPSGEGTIRVGDPVVVLDP